MAIKQYVRYAAIECYKQKIVTVYYVKIYLKPYTLYSLSKTNNNNKNKNKYQIANNVRLKMAILKVILNR